MSTDETKVKKTEKRVGFDEKGKALPGVDPKTGDRMSVTLEGLQAEFGAEEGEAKYIAIATIPVNGGVLFLDPRREKGHFPELPIANTAKAIRDQVAEIISTPQVKE